MKELPARSEQSDRVGDVGDKLRKRGLSNHKMQQLQYHVLVCNGGCCNRKGSERILQRFREAVSQLGNEHIRITETRCTGRCVDSCSVVIYPQGVWYREVTETAVQGIVEAHLCNGVIQQGLVSYTYQHGRFIATT